MIKYIVEIGYRKFEFDTIMEAGAFADTAFYHLKETESITIIIKEVTENDSESD